MIILTFKAKAVPENCSELLQSLTTMLEHVRKLKGCLSCYCYRSVEDDCEFFFVEQWATQEHLNAYMRLDLYSAIQGAFKVLTEHFEIELTTAEDTIQL
jgi:quinol monooxygenase YgiN